MQKKRGHLCPNHGAPLQRSWCSICRAGDLRRGSPTQPAMCRKMQTEEGGKPAVTGDFHRGYHPARDPPPINRAAQSGQGTSLKATTPPTSHKAWKGDPLEQGASDEASTPPVMLTAWMGARWSRGPRMMLQLRP
ncbi:hypothetical protein NDU88_004679 [Pleurodeles waltl]|uniref:Uncharacterized protein n=1 Tax=Pleurodeles waltl TaxID=8319 RepID=A0AAV7LIZ9_PLEWA|nr:hypothetical protein NDU88_004679 [Pleurodeles waltl]